MKIFLVLKIIKKSRIFIFIFLIHLEKQYQLFVYSVTLTFIEIFVSTVSIFHIINTKFRRIKIFFCSKAFKSFRIGAQIFLNILKITKI